MRVLRYAWLIACVNACDGCREEHAPEVQVLATAVSSTDVAVPIADVVDATLADVAAAEWLPSGTACRHAITHGSTFAQVHDDVLTRAIVRSYDQKLNADADITRYVGIDCQGDRITYQMPLREDAGAATVRVTRTKALGNRDGVYVRLDPDEIIIEGVRQSEVYECSPSKMLLVPIDDSVAMLVPKTYGTGENGDVTRSPTRDPVRGP